MQAYQTYFNIALIILSVVLTVAILLQTHGGMALGGEAMGQYKTRRGLEKTLFQVTVAFSVFFFVLVIINVFLLGKLVGQ